MSQRHVQKWQSKRILKDWKDLFFKEKIIKVCGEVQWFAFSYLLDQTSNIKNFERKNFIPASLLISSEKIRLISLGYRFHGSN